MSTRNLAFSVQMSVKPIYIEAAPLLSRGGVAARQKKSCEATLARADGVVLVNRWVLLTSTTPAAATASAFPSSAEEGSFYLQQEG
jgi:hypothetical protein